MNHTITEIVTMCGSDNQLAVKIKMSLTICRVSVDVPRHCRHGRNALPVSLNPPTAVLAKL